MGSLELIAEVLCSILVLVLAFLLLGKLVVDLRLGHEALLLLSELGSLPKLLAVLRPGRELVLDWDLGRGGLGDLRLGGGQHRSWLVVFVDFPVVLLARWLLRGLGLELLVHLLSLTEVLESVLFELVRHSWSGEVDLRLFLNLLLDDGPGGGLELLRGLLHLRSDVELGRLGRGRKLRGGGLSYSIVLLVLDLRYCGLLHGDDGRRRCSRAGVLNLPLRTLEVLRRERLLRPVVVVGMDLVVGWALSNKVVLHGWSVLANLVHRLLLRAVVVLNGGQDSGLNNLLHGLLYVESLDRLNLLTCGFNFRVSVCVPIDDVDFQWSCRWLSS